jgi:hypothetical protein
MVATPTHLFALLALAKVGGRQVSLEFTSGSKRETIIMHHCRGTNDH